MKRSRSKSAVVLSLAGACALLAGCGTTKWSDSARTATEQLLISDAVDRAVSEIDFSALAGRSVYLDTRFIITALDQNYLVSTLRQHMLASGCIIKDKAEESTYVVEVRTGSIGTNRQDLLFGVPSTTLPTVGLLPVGAASIPEIALMKRTNQQGVCKIACFAYDRMTGRSVWQSGNRRVSSQAKDVWVAGAGPFQSGTIYNGTAFAGERLDVPLVEDQDDDGSPSDMAVGREKVFLPHPKEENSDEASDDGVQNAGYVVPAGKDSSSGTPPAASGSTGAAATPASAPPKTDASAPAAGAAATPAAPKAAYTPPPPPAAAPPAAAAAAAGLQGNLPQTTVMSPTDNPAQSAAGAIQTYSWAKDLVGRQKQ